MYGYNCDIKKQVDILRSIVMKNTLLFKVIKEVQSIGLKNYYVGAGCICQTVWNYQNGFDLMYGISDIDFVYFDEDLSYEKEDSVIKQIEQKFSSLPVKIDVKNQARVHLWYKQNFGYDIKPYISVENAINSWPTTATSIGVRLNEDEFICYAPFGLNDMFGQVIRANKTQITKDTYIEKCTKWSSKWNTLNVIEW